MQAQGARWDADSKRWYVDAGTPTAKFARWLSEAEPEEEFTITSTDAYVAAATTVCQNCRSPIEVICIHCASGRVFGEPLSQFTVSDITAVSGSLARQLARWPHYREITEGAHFANHCPSCGAAQEDMYLHSEPDEIFFDIPGTAPGSIELTPLMGSVQLSGDEHFNVPGPEAELQPRSRGR